MGVPSWKACISNVLDLQISSEQEIKFLTWDERQFFGLQIQCGPVDERPPKTELLIL